ncbi:MAG: DUF1028 domain-containing protein [bacterium]
MRALMLASLVVFVLAGIVIADQAPLGGELAHTYSIVCYDPNTRQFGAAVQSHYFKVADVIWAKSGVGVVATQSLVDFNYGPLGLEMMQAGKPAQQALDGLLASDPGSDVRQVAFIDANGKVATHTGSKCIPMAGHQVGVNYSVQANLMANATVWPSMARAFESTTGDLAERMMAALEAAEAEGGDIRGRQSAAMLVVSGEPSGMDWKDKLIDLRVDDSPEPLVELRRLLGIARAYKHMDSGDLAIEVSDFAAAERHYTQAAELAPGNLEIRFWQAVALVTVGQIDLALPIFEEIFHQDNRWRELVPRLVAPGFFPDDSALIAKVTGL